MFSTKSEVLTLDILEKLQNQDQSITFDAVYILIDTLKASEPICYNQIYFDFDVISLRCFEGMNNQIMSMIDLDENNDFNFSEKIEKEVMIISALSLDD